ncbi:MAG: twin-arginine translocase TatA/TatE family subunit [Vampirovibrionales bacterium]|nr:twin-arginine translocase TatA/TatE family subunit [Vampirovibrionales bacterium]
MPSLGPFEIAVILVMVLILFGPGKLPQVFGALGDGMRQFKKASQGLTDEVNQTLSTNPEPPVTPTQSSPAEAARPSTGEQGTSPASPTSVS